VNAGRKGEKVSAARLKNATWEWGKEGMRDQDEIKKATPSPPEPSGEREPLFEDNRCLFGLYILLFILLFNSVRKFSMTMGI
jgi:hypothetical protein